MLSGLAVSVPISAKFSSALQCRRPASACMVCLFSSPAGCAMQQHPLCEIATLQARSHTPPKPHLLHPSISATRTRTHTALTCSFLCASHHRTVHSNTGLTSAPFRSLNTCQSTPLPSSATPLHVKPTVPTQPPSPSAPFCHNRLPPLVSGATPFFSQLCLVFATGPTPSACPIAVLSRRLCLASPCCQFCKKQT